MSLISDLLEMIEQEVSQREWETDESDVFWRCLSNAAAKKIRKRVKMVEQNTIGQHQMDEMEAQKFEKQLIPIGKYKGQRVLDASLEYLESLCDDSEFIRDLRRYVRSNRFIARGRADRHE